MGTRASNVQRCPSPNWNGSIAHDTNAPLNDVDLDKVDVRVDLQRIYLGDASSNDAEETTLDVRRTDIDQ